MGGAAFGLFRAKEDVAPQPGYPDSREIGVKRTGLDAVNARQVNPR
jgi:hypothetical protein